MKLRRKKTADDSMPRRRQSTGVDSEERYDPSRNSFRRGRTLTGSSSARISSSNELNADLLSPRAHVHHLSHRRRHIFLRLMGVLFMVLLLYVFLGQLVSTVTIADTGSSAFNERKTAYQAAIDKYLSSRPNERFYPSLNHLALERYVQSAYPEVEGLTIDLTGEFGQAQASVKLKQPVARWTIDGTEHFVDDAGSVYDFTTSDRPTLEIIDKTGASTKDGIVASNRFLSFVGRIVGELKYRGYKVTKAIIPPLTTRQLEVRLQGVPYRFKLTIDRSAGEQAEDISRIIPYLKKKSLTPSYVDVRVEEKAFYK